MRFSLHLQNNWKILDLWPSLLAKILTCMRTSFFFLCKILLNNINNDLRFFLYKWKSSKYWKNIRSLALAAGQNSHMYAYIIFFSFMFYCISIAWKKSKDPNHAFDSFLAKGVEIYNLLRRICKNTIFGLFILFLVYSYYF